MRKKKKADKQNVITDWVQIGAEISGNAAGAVLGGMFAGLEGAVIGTSIAPLITETFSKIGADIKTMIFGNREEVRIGAAYTFAISKINEKLDAGFMPRNDDYFTTNNNQRPVSEEILEGALMLAQKEYEELKVKHYGYLIANIYFDTNIDRGYANFLLRLAERLSYRQLCLLELFSNTVKYELLKMPPPKAQFPELEKIDPGLYKAFNQVYSTNSIPSTSQYIPVSYRSPLKNRKADLNMEIEELEQLKLIERGVSYAPITIVEHFANMGVTSIGRTLRNLMELAELNINDIEEIAAILRLDETNS